MVYKKRMEIRRFVIPDVHGCALTLHHLLQHTLQVRKTDRIYLLGDMIDRGPRSKELLDLLMEFHSRGFYISCLRGNHEQMLLDAHRSPDCLQTWILNGGFSTLDSFRISKVANLPRRYLDFLDRLPFFIELHDFILVHGGMNFDNDPFTDTRAMLWSREGSIDMKKTSNRRLICGHTPHRRDEIRASIHGDMITLDNGCVYREPGLGSLAALELNSLELVFQPNLD